MTRIVSNWRVNTYNTKLEHIDKFQPGDIFYVPSLIPPIVLQHWVETYGTPDFIVCDHAGEIKIPGLKIYSAPLRGLAFSFEKFQKLSQTSFARHADTKVCFNFFINNFGRTNRSLLIKLIEYFKLDCFDYVLNDNQKYHDMQLIVNELNTIDNKDFSPKFRNTILAPSKLAVKHNKNFSSDRVEEMIYKHYEWQNNLDLLFDKSAVSLVGEPCFSSQLASIFSEKTLYAIMGLTFPIYIGGYGHADYLKKIGLDTFDDIIDHSYQHRTTIVEQCFYAFKDNLHILTNLPLAQQLRQTHLDRLLKNRDLLYDGILTQHVYDAVGTWPEPLSSAIKSYWYFIQNLQVGKVMRGYYCVE